MPTRTPLARQVIAAAFAALLAACQSWQTTPYSAQTLIPAEQPSSVRVTWTSGDVATLQYPWIRNDSVLGTVGQSTVGRASEDVRLLEVRRTHNGRTLGLVALFGAALIGGTVLVANTINSGLGGY